ncbi:MAG: hypothetical protein GY878_14170 [Fuerstiella sp.]|nr:hypothetical protein [Fuerstiella sp.]
MEANLQLEKELAQAKLELKLERQNKFATNEQKKDDSADDETAAESTDDSSAATEKKKRGAPVGHPGWFRPTPRNTIR